MFQAFFAPERLVSEGGVDPLLRGLFAAPIKMPRPDQLLNKELTEKLFNRYHEVALDLAALNIQRGRDHGLPTWTEYRKFCNLTVPKTWRDLKKIVQNDTVIEKLQSLYGVPGQNNKWWSWQHMITFFREHWSLGRWCDWKTYSGSIDGSDLGVYHCWSVPAPQRWRPFLVWERRRLYQNTTASNQKSDTFKDRVYKRWRHRQNTGLRGNPLPVAHVINFQRDIFVYHGNSTQFYESCDSLPEINLNMWTSCCDAMCSSSSALARNAIGGEEKAKKRKKRHHAKKSCHDEGKRHRTGERWDHANDLCTECMCDVRKLTYSKLSKHIILIFRTERCGAKPRISANFKAPAMFSTVDQFQIILQNLSVSESYLTW